MTFLCNKLIRNEKKKKTGINEASNDFNIFIVVTVALFNFVVKILFILDISIFVFRVIEFFSSEFVSVNLLLELTVSIAHFQCQL